MVPRLAPCDPRGVLVNGPGSPWENGYVESFNGKLRDELLNMEVFNTLLEAKVLIEQWQVHFNTVRPHSSLRYRPRAPEVMVLGSTSSAIGSAKLLKPEMRMRARCAVTRHRPGGGARRPAGTDAAGVCGGFGPSRGSIGGGCGLGKPLNCVTRDNSCLSEFWTLRWPDKAFETPTPRYTR